MNHKGVAKPWGIPRSQIYIPGLVNCHILLWKDPPFSMGKSTISTGPFSIAMLNYQRVDIIDIHGL